MIDGENEGGDCDEVICAGTVCTKKQVRILPRPRHVDQCVLPC